MAVKRAAHWACDQCGAEGISEGGVPPTWLAVAFSEPDYSMMVVNGQSGVEYARRTLECHFCGIFCVSDWAAHRAVSQGAKGLVK